MANWEELYKAGEGKSGMASDLWNKGMQTHKMKQQLYMTDEEIQEFTERLTRNIGTQTSSAQNRFSESAAYADMPLASRLAGQRGINYQSLLKTREGTENIERMAKETNRNAAMFLLNQQFQAEQAEKNRDAMMWGSIFGMGGSAAGGYLGGL